MSDYSILVKSSESKKPEILKNRRKNLFNKLELGLEKVQPLYPVDVNSMTKGEAMGSVVKQLS